MADNGSKNRRLRRTADGTPYGEPQDQTLGDSLRHQLDERARAFGDRWLASQLGRPPRSAPTLNRPFAFDELPWTPPSRLKRWRIRQRNRACAWRSRVALRIAPWLDDIDDYR